MNSENDMNDQDGLVRTENFTDTNDVGNSEFRVDTEESLIPKEGMTFDTADDAFKFYNQYALSAGFGVRKSSSYSSKKDISITIGRKFVCDKEGKRKTNSERVIDINESHTRETRVGCKALMRISLTKSGSWRISKFVSEHNNHALSTPSKAGRHRSHTKIHKASVVKRLITTLHGQGLANANIVKVVNVLEPDLAHTITSQQVHEHIRVERRSNLGKSCSLVVDHFMDRKGKDPGFYFNIELDTDCTLRSVFWADRRSQVSYQKFSDVIVFDVTYRTNSFSLPFAPFTGINHHYQSSLFGCALLADETEETFVWLFQEWLKCMDGKAPKVIITDQDAAMGNAIARVFPNTLHRFCDWHLERNIGENLKNLKDAYPNDDIELDFNNLRNSDNIVEAELAWSEMMEKYNFREKSWLPKLWEQRKSWVPCYLKDIFVAGTRSSQRSESMNSFFDTYVTSSTPLHEFVVQYEKALISRRKAEEDEDFKTLNTNPMLVLGWLMEEQAAKCYTRKVFGFLHTEMKDSVSYLAEKLNKVGTITEFRVGRAQDEKSVWKIVTYNKDGVFVSCSCKRFENTGWLCKHAFSVLVRKLTLKIPDRYILTRWTMEARYHSEEVGFGNYAASDIDRELIWDFRLKLNKVLEKALKSPIFLKEMDDIITEKLADEEDETIEEEETQGDPIDSQYAMNTTPGITIRDPGVARTKGRPRIPSRIQSSLEKSQNESKKRTCGFCGEKGHYRTGCKKAKEMEKRNTGN